MQRLFIAFPITGEAAQEIERVQHELEEQNKGVPITWTRTQPHCTLAFLGDCDEETTRDLRERLLTLEGGGVLRLRLGATGAFPHLHRPRVAVIHLVDAHGDAGRLFRAVRDVVTDCGILLEDRLFTPHVTLGRVKGIGGPVRGLREMHVKPVSFSVTEMVLFASELLPQGPRHTPLTKVILEPSEDGR